MLISVTGLLPVFIVPNKKARHVKNDRHFFVSSGFIWNCYYPMNSYCCLQPHLLSRPS